ncbi:MAG: zinc-ribbon domain-containing protein [Ruminococcaceae bacterium]|nr:zinc-ribbon domain-containing protein [Oscillospiraceae bacterium]
MEEFVEKIKKGAAKAVDEAEKLTKAAVSKTSALVGQTKLTYAMNTTEEKIAERLARIGQFVYEEYQTGSEFPEDIAEICREIDVLHQEIANMKEQIASMKNAVLCPNCGASNDNTNQFCAKCGEKLSD